MKTDANEPIQADPNYGNVGAAGLTKREYFAGLAMQGYLSKDGADEVSTVNETAEWAVKMSDALINALNK